MKTWRCFHCDDVFRTQVDARNHFGSDQSSEPACQIKVAGEFALLQALRNAEDELCRYRSEDSDVLRAMWSAQADHATALRREEEKGYERGLRDAKAYPETLGLQQAAQETRSASFGLEINGEAQQVRKCPTCERDFIGGASDRYCGSDHCVLEPEQG